MSDDGPGCWTLSARYRSILSGISGGIPGEIIDSRSSFGEISCPGNLLADNVSNDLSFVTLSQRLRSTEDV
jgi:hypothetical protein